MQDILQRLTSVETKLDCGLQGLREDILQNDRFRKERLEQLNKNFDDAISSCQHFLRESIAEIDAQQEKHEQRIHALEREHEQRKGAKSTLAIVASVFSGIGALCGYIINMIINNK